jgi:ferredoxin
MIRKIIHIDEDKCNGCGLCANACKESAIAMVNGKAKLIRDDYCDGLGNCLPVCPTGAISFIIGCPKLDEGNYAEKLTEILKNNEIKSITVVRMEVPCCGGIVNAVKSALMNCGKLIPWQVVTISTDGEILEEA